MTPEEMQAAVNEGQQNAAAAAAGGAVADATGAPPAGPGAATTQALLGGAPQPQPGQAAPPSMLAVSDIQALEAHHGKAYVDWTKPVDPFVKKVLEPTDIQKATGEQPKPVSVKNDTPSYQVSFADGKKMVIRPHVAANADGTPGNPAKADYFELTNPGDALKDQSDIDALHQAQSARATAGAANSTAHAAATNALQGYKDQNDQLSPGQVLEANLRKSQLDYEREMADIRSKLGERKLGLDEAIHASSVAHQKFMEGMSSAQLELQKAQFEQNQATQQQHFAGDIAHATVAAMGQTLPRTISGSESRNLNAALNWLAHPSGPAPTFEANTDPALDPTAMVMNAVKQGLALRSPAMAQSLGQTPNANPPFSTGNLPFMSHDLSGLPAGVPDITSQARDDYRTSTPVVNPPPGTDITSQARDDYRTDTPVVGVPGAGFTPGSPESTPFSTPAMPLSTAQMAFNDANASPQGSSLMIGDPGSPFHQLLASAGTTAGNARDQALAMAQNFLRSRQGMPGAPPDASMPGATFAVPGQ